MKTINPIILLILSAIIIGSCKNNAQKDSVSQGNSKAEETSTTSPQTDNSTFEVNKLSVVYGEDKEDIKAFYELPHIKEFYDWQEMAYTEPPTLEYPTDLSVLSYEELRLLRNEVFARNGYLFNDAFLRGYFNRFKWYMPVFDVDTFKVVLNSEERSLIDKILNEEAKRKETSTVSQGELQLYNSELIVNSKQFTQIPTKVEEDFRIQNFSIIDANRSMPFYAYDENAYQFIPHYITTDLYLFILHKYFSTFIEKLDENFMYAQLTSVLKQTSHELEGFSSTNHQPIVEWAKMYNALALYAIGDSLATAPALYNQVFFEEKENIDMQSGKPVFISNDFVDYRELKPRGHYTKSESLQNYFRGFKWIALNGIDLSDDEQLRGLILFAYTIKSNKKIYNQYSDFVSVMEKLAGREDNLSLSDIINSISAKTIDDVLSDKQIESIRNKLTSLKKEKIAKVFGESFATDERDVKRVYFLSSTYSISGEVFSKLVHVDGLNSKRPFPRGLDIPAVFNNSTAQEIITEEYRDNERWPDYLSRLKNLQKQFREFDDWNHNYGFKGLATALSASSEQDNYPDFMKTDAYNRKELSTSLASWTHIKHDLILYQEKPWAAEAGQGGGPEPPQHYSYVEPNLKFWDSALELVDWLEDLTRNEPFFADKLTRIKDLGVLLRNTAYKQINGEEISKEEYNKLHWVGGTVEYIFLGLLQTDHLPDREKSMALIADVYVYNGENLNVAVGHADDIYVIVPIKGEYFISRGSVFSYYEFKGGIMTDEEWRANIEQNDIPERPSWISPLINDLEPLKGQMQYRY